MFIKKSLITALLIIAGLMPVLLHADDTEVYFGEAQDVNLLLVLDVSGSMAWTTDTCRLNRWGQPYPSCYPSNGEKSRLEIMKEALEVFLNDLPDNVKVGMVTYSSGNNIDLQHEVKELTANNHKAELLATINSLEANGGTLSAGALYEAASYYRGEYGNFPSPITPGCGNASNIVFLTDGEPNSLSYDRYHYRDQITAMTGKSCQRSDDGKDCTEKLASYLSSTDQVAKISPSQVKTHTIAFALENQGARDFLQNVADNGKGKAFTADSTEGLVEAFKTSIQSDIEQSMMVAPSVPFSQSNRLNSSNELFLAMFQPAKTQFWHGNLKKYYLKDGQVVDSNDAVAVDDNGQFLESASSAWSLLDGNKLALGGAAQAMDMPRNVYSNILEKNLWTQKNKISTTNNKITRQLLGLPATASDAQLTNHIEWLFNGSVEIDSNGDDQLDRTIKRYGDPLHSKPVVIDYADKSLLFMGDNEGYLHAINTADNSGKEEWSFIPRQLLKNTAELFENNTLASVSSRMYGLDGDITVYHQDKNRNGKVDDGEKAYLYVGMRRGGQNYYAIDISDSARPQLMFTITGDLATSEEITAGLSWDSVHYYEGLGQTWSKPIIGHIKWKGGKKLVMIFGGGYDAKNQDNHALEANTPDTVGHNIFIADAVSGQMLWNARDDAIDRRGGDFASQLTNSFASDLSAGDLRGSGTIEHIYATDTGGQLFRFDITQENKNSNTQIYGVKLADIAGSGVVGNRRFYNRPDVSFVKLRGKTMALIAVGSGFRAHPLAEDTNDRFYVFYDKHILTGGYPEQVLTESTLYDVTDKVDTDPNDETKGRYVGIFDILDHETTNNGWYLRLADGEKVLADASTINYRVLFTTYKPGSDEDNEEENTCKAIAGQNKLYTVSVLDGKPIFFKKNNQNGEFVEYVRSTDLGFLGIAPEPTVVYPDDGNGGAGDVVKLVGLEVICSGAECDYLNELNTVKWRELTKKELEQVKND
ncbi:PilC/PilY family type IV pilus protein [Kangiella sp.]|uniref:PilC/PilY family type IV pilus protein n=1 Tax=Kangiella sp. TaxID=1920245 RepID=UPI0019B1570E|nr:PilC/PilY family type IV pilus protein [Kangiella sp.]MBD3653675.1 VWA domain-containing protein [Kangiella sp.]